jgi:hypothetical protein
MSELRGPDGEPLDLEPPETPGGGQRIVYRKAAQPGPLPALRGMPRADPAPVRRAAPTDPGPRDYLGRAITVEGTSVATDAELATAVAGAGGGLTVEDVISDPAVRAAYVRVENERINVLNLLPPEVGYEDVTDWAPYIREAMGDGGREVYLPGGTLNIGGKVGAGDLGAGNKWAITVPSNTKLEGRGQGDTRLRAADSLPIDTPLLKVWGAKNVELCHFELDGNKQRATAWGEDEGIGVAPIEPEVTVRPANVHIHHVWVHDTGQDGIDNDGCDDFYLSDALITDCWGLANHNRGFGSGNVIVSRVILRNNAHERLAAGGINAPSASAIDYQGSGTFLLTDSVIENNAKGVIIHSGAGARVDGVSIKQASGLGTCVEINTSGTNGEIDVNGTFEGGLHTIDVIGGRAVTIGGVLRMLSGTTDGIYASGYDGLSILPRTIRRLSGSGQRGITILAAAADSTKRWSVQGGLIAEMQHGIQVDAAAVGGSIRGVDIAVTNDAVRIQGPADDVSVIGNVLKGARSVFMTTPGGSPTNAKVIGNVMTATGTVYTAAGTGHVKQANVENGVWVA